MRHYTEVLSLDYRGRFMSSGHHYLVRYCVIFELQGGASSQIVGLDWLCPAAQPVLPSAQAEPSRGWNSIRVGAPPCSAGGVSVAYLTPIELWKYKHWACAVTALPTTRYLESTQYSGEAVRVLIP